MGNLIFVPDTSSPLSRKMYAVDHGVAFGGPDWTAEQLELEKTDIRVENHLTFIHELANQQKGDLDKYLNKVESLTRADIYNILQQIPKGWGVSLREEVKLLDYLLIRQSLIRPTFTEAFKIW